ncbi:Copper resistance protein D [Sinorhizobium alkalisoli]|nr:Copper resistance protein D [Sinorhizobium alkalisoli]
MTLALFGVLAQIAVASAHASYTSSNPEDGDVVETAPSRYAIAFSEPVSPLSLKLVRPDGSSIPLERFEVKDKTVEIVAPTGLGRGTHVLSWRVISADGHPVGGSVVFSINEADAAPPPIVDEIDRTVRAGVLGSKVALYIGLFIGVCGVFASVWLLGGSRPGRNVAGGALGIGILGALASAGFQGLDALAAPVARIAEPIVWSTAMATSFGHTVAVAVLAFTIAAAALLSGKGPISRPSSFLAFILAGLALSLSGHAAAAQPQWLMRPAVFVHAAAIAFWVGALAPLGLALKRADPAAVAGLRRFSAMVPFAVAALVGAGVTLAIVISRSLRYGPWPRPCRKIGAHRRAVPARRHQSLEPYRAGFGRDGPATTRLVRTIAIETAIVLLIFRSRRPGVSRRRRAPWPPPRLSLRRCISTPARRWPSFR